MLWLIFKISWKNSLRHRLRTLLTVFGLSIAILAFGLLRTLVDAWHSGAAAASEYRLITRNAISLTFPLPISYLENIRTIDGIHSVSWANWFGGIYIDSKHFFPQFAIEPRSYLALYQEYITSVAEQLAFTRERHAAMVGRQLAQRFGWKLGDTIHLKGTIYPGDWPLTIRAIYHGKNAGVEENHCFLHWDYLNERLKQQSPTRANRVGVFIVGVKEHASTASIAKQIDAAFSNTIAETHTETEQAFHLNFIAMTEIIITVIRSVALVIIFVILAIMANTIAMSARERNAEYATLKALGFQPSFIGMLIVGESLGIACLGGGLGIVLSFPAVTWIAQSLVSFLPQFRITYHTLILQLLSALLVALGAALLPAYAAMRMNIIKGLGRIT